MEKLYRIFERHCAEYHIELDSSAQTAVESKIQDMVDHANGGVVDLGRLDDLFRHVLANRARRTDDAKAAIILSDVI